MPRVRLPSFVGPSYTAESRIAAYDRTVNLYPEKIESGTGQNSYWLPMAPGYATFCELPDTPVRGFYSLNGTTWAVGGESLYRLPLVAGDPPTLLTTGLTNPDGGWVTIAGNGDAGHQLLLSSGSFKYCFDIPTNTLTVQDGLAQQVGYLGGYGIALDVARSEFSLSGLVNFANWDPLDVTQRSDSPDKWIAMLVQQISREAWFFGSQTTSIYYIGNDPAIPFVPNPSVLIMQGTAAPLSPAVLKGSPIWLGQGIGGDRVVYWASGYTPNRVSTHAVELAFSAFTPAQVAAAQAFVYEELGHSFYVLRFPPVSEFSETVIPGATWVFDGTTSLWHERGLWNGWSYDALPINGHVFANGMHLVGSPDSGFIYQMSKSLLLGTNGIGQRWLRRCPHIAKDHQYMVIDAWEILAEVGLGLPSGQGSDPMLSGSWSRNGGQTFSPEQAKTMGRTGAFSTRVIFRSLGRGNDFVLEASGSDPSIQRLIDAFVHVRVAA